MGYGTATLVFQHFEKSGTPDELGAYAMVPVTTSAPNCRHRPLTFKEVVDANLDIATEYWRSTIPLSEYNSALVGAIIAIKAIDAFTVAGIDYQIIGGIRPHDDFEGLPFKATIISQKQTG